MWPPQPSLSNTVPLVKAGNPAYKYYSEKVKQNWLEPNIIGNATVIIQLNYHNNYVEDWLNIWREP